MHYFIHLSEGLHFRLAKAEDELGLTDNHTRMIELNAKV